MKLINEEFSLLIFMFNSKILALGLNFMACLSINFRKKRELTTNSYNPSFYLKQSLFLRFCVQRFQILNTFSVNFDQKEESLIIIRKKNMNSSGIHKQYLQRLYNQNVAVEDADQTSFCYLKTLALQLLIVIFVSVSIIASLLSYFGDDIGVSKTKMYIISSLFTILTITTIVFQKLALLEWIRQKKDYQTKPMEIYLFMTIQIIFLIPTPNILIDTDWVLSTTDIYRKSISFKVEELLAAYVLIRCIYFLKFLIHCQLFYGSRPDRLSRLYTVRFGTFNAFKFLINEKPHVILMIIFFLNYLLLPLILFLVQGKVNSKLDNFTACIYYQVVTQVTVGYGDITVSTIIGRAIMVISIIIGITTTSILLIFFMRLMEQDTRQEESHTLLKILERKQFLTKSMVQRVETQIFFLSKKVPLQKREEYEEKLNKLKFKNARKIRHKKDSTPNLKRMMMSNFSALLQGVHGLKQTEIMLARYIKIIQNSHEVKQKTKLVSAQRNNK